MKHLFVYPKAHKKKTVLVSCFVGDIVGSVRIGQELSYSERISPGMRFPLNADEDGVSSL